MKNFLTGFVLILLAIIMVIIVLSIYKQVPSQSMAPYYIDWAKA